MFYSTTGRSASATRCPRPQRRRAWHILRHWSGER